MDMRLLSERSDLSADQVFIRISQRKMPPITRKRKATEVAPPASQSSHPPGPTAGPSRNTNTNENSNANTTDRSKMVKPVMQHIHPSMLKAWAIYHYFQPCILFDAASPLRRFKRGTVFNEDDDDPYPDYHPRDEAEATETDEEGVLQPYKPTDYKCV
jgi:hypothetical protein